VNRLLRGSVRERCSRLNLRTLLLFKLDASAFPSRDDDLLVRTFVGPRRFNLRRSRYNCSGCVVVAVEDRDRIGIRNSHDDIVLYV